MSRMDSQPRNGSFEVRFPEPRMLYLKNAHLPNHPPNGHLNNPRFTLITTESLDSILETDPATLDQTMKRKDWPQWKTTLKAEYASLQKHNMFSDISDALEKPPIGHKLIFT